MPEADIDGLSGLSVFDSGIEPAEEVDVLGGVVLAGFPVVGLCMSRTFQEESQYQDQLFIYK